jgi:hypothetical protein
MWASEKISNYGQIIRANSCQRWKLFTLYLMAKSFSHQLQLLVKFTVKQVSLFNAFLTTTTNRWNFIWLYASIKYYSQHHLFTQWVLLSNFRPQKMNINCLINWPDACWMGTTVPFLNSNVGSWFCRLETLITPGRTWNLKTTQTVNKYTYTAHTHTKHSTHTTHRCPLVWNKKHENNILNFQLHGKVETEWDISASGQCWWQYSGIKHRSSIKMLVRRVVWKWIQRKLKVYAEVTYDGRAKAQHNHSK